MYYAADGIECKAAVEENKKKNTKKETDKIENKAL